MAVIAAAAAAPAAAHVVACGKRAQILASLAHTYGERRVALGAEAGGGVLELVVNRETGTWTAIITFADGSSCKLADGDGWQDLTAARRGQGS